MLEMRDVRISYNGSTLVDRACFKLQKGRVLGLVGASGSGKTLLSLAILGLLPDGIDISGQIFWHNDDIVSAREDRLAYLRGREIGIIFQNTSAALDPLMTIGDHIADLFRRHHGYDRQSAYSAAMEIFRRVEWPVNIDPFDRYPHEISGGQRQRVLIALAIALNPALIIADEPTASLDVTTASIMLDLLRRIAIESNCALLLISHDLPALATRVDAIAFLENGIIDQAHDIDALRRRQVPDGLLSLFDRSIPDRKLTRPLADDASDVAHISDLVISYQASRFSLLPQRDKMRAVDHVSFVIKKGQCLALVGESGSGKSTLARALIGIQDIDQGQIDVLTFNPYCKATQQRYWQKSRFVFQDSFSAVDPNWTIRRIVAEPLALLDHKPAQDDANARVEAALARVGIDSTAFDFYPHQLSGGQMQRVALARALMTSPDLLILDEPISALDAEARGQILDLLFDLMTNAGLTILLITHDLGVARAIADQIMVMKSGQIVEAAEALTLLENPQTDYTKALIAASPIFAAASLATADLAGKARRD